MPAKKATKRQISKAYAYLRYWVIPEWEDFDEYVIRTYTTWFVSSGFSSEFIHETAKHSLYWRSFIVIIGGPYVPAEADTESR
jgi:hypothetical protein